MSETRIELSAEARALVERMGSSAVVLDAIRRGMDFQNQLTLGEIVEKRLTGKGPYPVSEHRLGERSHLYRKSVRAAAAVVNGGTVESSIGANVVYAGIHEFGGVIAHAARKGNVRLRTDKAGNLQRRGANGKLATFAKRHNKYAKTVEYQGKAYTVRMPARAPITTGIESRLTAYGEGISREVVKAMEGGGS